MNGVSGVMYYSFGQFKLLPRDNADFENYEGGTAVSLDRNEVTDASLKIYPNPSADIINFISTFDDKSYQLELYNTLGEKVWEAEANGKVSQFGLYMIDNGQYILRVTEEGSFVESFQLILYR